MLRLRRCRRDRTPWPLFVDALMSFVLITDFRAIK